MSQQHIALWQQAADAFDQRYQALNAEQMSAGSPCEGWNCKEVVDHAVQTQINMGGGMAGAQIPEGAEWPAVKSAIEAALQVEGALDGTTEFGPMGEVPKSMLFSIGTSDLLLHTWDVARAAGLDETLPAEVVTAAYMGLQRFPPEMMRAEGRFGPAIECAEDADEQTKLLMFSGRQV